MNKTYRVVWNRARECFIAAHEHARSGGKTTTSGTRSKGAIAIAHADGFSAPLKLTAIAVLLTFPGALLAADLPTNGQIIAGSGSISQSGTTMTVTQDSAKLAANWQSFSIGKGHTVNFVQPSASAIAFNRVIGSDVSVIQGALNANGQVFLINPNGVLFTSSAQVNAGGLVASTLNMSTEDFLAGNYKFEGDSSGAIINQGSIRAANGGTVALIAAKIENTGSITANEGNVLLGAGQKVTLDLGGPVKLQVEQGAIDALIQNGGAIKADGGTVLLTAKAAQDLASTVINNDGIIEARSLDTGENGEIVLLGEQGTVEVGGIINVSGDNGTGGKAVVTGDRVLIADGAHIDATSAQGGGEIYVGGGWQGQDPAIKQATATVIMQGATLDASATDNGNGGTIVAWSDVSKAESITRVAGTLKARGGDSGGNGGRIETSGHGLEVGQAPDLAAPAGEGGEWLIDPYNITVVEGGGNTNINGASPFESSGNSAELGINLIDAALQNGGVVIQTAGPTGDGEQGGDITWDVDYTYAGYSDTSLTLNAHRDIILNKSISSGPYAALSMSFNADSDSNGTGGTVVKKNLSTNGGSLVFNGLGAIFSGVSTQQVSTNGGSVSFNGEVLLANPNGLTIATSNGDVTFGGKLNSGNSYAYDATLRNWSDANTAVTNGVGDVDGSTYLATITSALENTAVMAAAGGNQAWLGGSDEAVEGTWRWVSGPEGMEDGGKGRIIQTSGAGQTGYVGTNGAYVNWNAGEPNNDTNEDYAQIGFGTAGQWNDLGTAHTIGAVVETNLAASPLTINAGAGTVTFDASVGGSKALASLDVTADTIAINGGSIKTEGTQTYNGDVDFGSVAQFLNPSFEDGLVGWAITDGRVYLNGGSTIGGFATPNDTTMPGSVASGCNTATGAGCDTSGWTGSFNTGLSNDAGSGAQSLVMNSGGNCNDGYCIVRGPYVISDSTVTLTEGGMVSFQWQAKGGSDAYDVYGYLLNTATGKVQKILDQTGQGASAQQPWTTATVSANEAGTYKFVFVSGSWDETGGRALGAQLYIDNIQAAGARTIDAAKVDFRGTVTAANNNFVIKADEVDFGGAVSGTETLTLQQRTDTLAINIGGAGDTGAGSMDLTATDLANLQDGFSSITIGSTTASGSTTISGASTFNDNVTVRNATGGIAVNEVLTATGANNITFDTQGPATQTASGVISAGGLELLGGGTDYQLDTADNNVGMLAANTGSVSFNNGGALTIGSTGSTEGVNATGGPIHISTSTGDLTVASNLVTTDTSDAAIVLNAGRDANAGDATGGDVVLSGNPAMATGAAGRTLIYTGSVAGSTGVTSKVGSGTSRFRYNSDETTTNYTKALDSAIHAIYREAPTVTVTANSYSKIYDGEAYGGAIAATVSGLQNGDTQTGSASYAGGDINAGTYTIEAQGEDSGLGYNLELVDGALTIDQRPVNVTASSASKTYGDADVLTYTAEAQSGNRGLVTGDTLNGALSREAGEDVGTYAINLGTLANGNYVINYTGANLVIAKRAITLAADIVSKVYGETDPVLTISIVGGNLGSQAVNDTLADVTGALSRELGDNVGNYNVALGAGAKAGNYDITFNTDNNALTITQRPIVVRANDQQKMQGTLDPALTYSAEAQSAGRGLLNGESLFGELVRESGDGVGGYAISHGTLVDANNPNYVITFLDGELTILPATEVKTAQHVAQILPQVVTQSHNTVPQGELASFGGEANGALQPVSGQLSDASGDAQPAGNGSNLHFVELTGGEGADATGIGGDSNSTAGTGDADSNADAGNQFDVASRSDFGPLTVFVVKGGIKLPVYDSAKDGQ